MEEFEDGPGPSSSSKKDGKGESVEAANDNDAANITLPEQLQKISPAEEFVSVRHRWNTSEEIASILIAFNRHKEWLMLPQKIRPASGSMLLYNRKVVFYRRDGYCWKKRRNGSTIREDHMKLKVQGLECIYGSYVHSAILPTFHRRCYWLLQNPNIVLLHYLNVPYPEAAKPSILTVFSELKQKEWTKEELVDQLRPMLSQVGQTTDEDTDEEKKVERILEELLPMLMPSKDEKGKQVFSLSHGLGNRILTPAHTATLNRLIAPRQTPSTSQLQVFHQPHPTQHQKQEQERIIPQADHQQMKTKDTQIQLPVFVNNSIAQPLTHKGLNPVQITTHSQYRPILFQVPTDDNGLSTLSSKPRLQSATSICTVKGGSKNITSIQQTAPSNITIFSNDSNNLIQRQNIENHQRHNIQQQQPHSFNRQQMIMHNTLVNNVVVPTTSIGSLESDAEMSDTFGNHSSNVSKNGVSNTFVKKNNEFSSQSEMSRVQSSHLNTSSLNALMEADVNASSVAAMDVTVQSQGQIVQQSFHPSELYPKVAQTCTHQHSTHQQQQNLSQLQQVAQQNHSPLLQNLAQNSNQLPSDPQPLSNTLQPQQPQQHQQTPLLTLHLKSATSTTDNNPGFVLSLQGATLVTPDSSSMAMSSGNPAQPLNISNSNGLVLIASQNPSGQLVLNRISDNTNTANINHSSTNQISTAAAPGAPYIMPSSTPSSEQQVYFKSEANQSNLINPSINPAVVSIQPSIAFPGLTSQNTHIFSSSTMSRVNVLPSLSYPMNGCNTVNNVNQQQQSTSGLNTLTPLKDNDFQKASSSSCYEKIAFPASSVRNNNLTRTSPSSLSSLSMTTSVHDPTKDLRKPMLYSLDTNATANINTPSVPETKDFNKMDMSSSNLVGTQSQLNGHQTSHDTLINSVPHFFHNDKDMMTNPDSCDTLDGSFSSLPTSDLNLDDFLDLHDLQDLTVSPLGPVDISTSSPSTSHYCWDSNSTLSSANPCTTDSHVLSMGKSATTERSVDILHNKSDASSITTDHLHLYTNQQQLPHFLSCHEGYENQHQISPTSPNHPGAPPRTFPRFNATTPVSRTSTPLSCTATPLPSSPLTHNPHCDSHGTVAEDPEIGSVIMDFAPGWAYSKTNTKVLIAGPWNKKDAQYTCVFDGDHILAVLLQQGLLRCYTPFHNAGYSTLQVARDGVIVSNCEIFEFCDNEKEKVQAAHPEWFDFEKTKLKMLLMERLHQLQQRLTSLSIPSQDVREDNEAAEHSLVERVEKLLGQPWANIDQYPKAGQHNLTLLHLAAALGLAKFISCLIKWRKENNSVALEYEVDALSVDSHSCTPLMWACSLGNIDAALTLYRWNALPLKMCNKDGLLPLSLARQKGHYNLANQIEQLEFSKEKESDNSASKASTSCQDSTHHLNMDITSPPPSVSASSVAMSGKKSMVSKDEEKKETETVSSFRTPHPSFPKPVTPGPKLIRRFSEQAIGQLKGTLNKRNSVDLLPSGQDIDQATLPTLGSSLATSREASSEPQLPVSPDMAYVASPAPRLLLEDKIDEPSNVYTPDPSSSRMDTDETVPATSSSPIIDVERISSDEELDQGKDGSKHQMVTLANQIIAAIPERIKLSPSKSDDLDDTASSGRGRSESHSSLTSQGSPRPSSFGDDSGISTPVTESLSFDEYRYPEFGTPASSLSPESTCLPSPYSPYSFTLDSPPPTTAEFTEYFNAPTTYMEKDFSQLTLSDQEQRKLYEAAKVIQNAYRHYRDKQNQQQKEIEAAVLIQSYYRRYKTYAYYKKMSHAAVLIQNQFRTYYAKRKKRVDSSGSLQGLRRESERLKKGRNQSVIIQQRFRSHYQRRSFEGKEASGSGQGSGDAPNSSPPPPTTHCHCPDEHQTITAEENDILSSCRALEEQKSGLACVAVDCDETGNEYHGVQSSSTD